MINFYKNGFDFEDCNEILTNCDLTTYDDVVIKLCLLEILLDKSDQLTIDKAKLNAMNI